MTGDENKENHLLGILSCCTIKLERSTSDFSLQYQHNNKQTGDENREIHQPGVVLLFSDAATRESRRLERRSGRDDNCTRRTKRNRNRTKCLTVKLFFKSSVATQQTLDCFTARLFTVESDGVLVM